MTENELIIDYIEYLHQFVAELHADRDRISTFEERRKFLETGEANLVDSNLSSLVEDLKGSHLLCQMQIKKLSIFLPKKDFDSFKCAFDSHFQILEELLNKGELK